MSAPLPTPDEIDRIVRRPDLAVRNLQITQCYHELSLALHEQVGPAANWCTFATWTSKQAGQTVRKEDLVRTLEEALHVAPAGRKALDELAESARRIGGHGDARAARAALWYALDPAGILERTSQAVSAGNLKVFQEIGRAFARFIEVLRASADAGTVARLCAELRPGEPPDGQAYLCRAFAHYAAAR